VLLTIKNKWLEAIVHMIKFEFLDLSCPSSILSIHIYGKFRLSTTFSLLGFQENIQNFIPQAETSLKGEAFVVPPTIIPNDNVQWSVKCKFDFVESKSIYKQKPF
jgi:hypothetical protein